MSAIGDRYAWVEYNEPTNLILEVIEIMTPTSIVVKCVSEDSPVSRNDWILGKTGGTVDEWDAKWWKFIGNYGKDRNITNLYEILQS